MKDPELDILIDELESRRDMPLADFAGVINALRFLLPSDVAKGIEALKISTSDGAILVADAAFPNWVIRIRGRANDRDGHWRCTLRQNDSRDNDSAIGTGRSPVLAQAILAAILRLSMTIRRESPA